MKAQEVGTFITGLQNSLYNTQRKISISSPSLGRLSAIPVSLIDVGLETLKGPLSALENVTLIFRNVLGAPFSENYSLKDALCSFEYALRNAAYTGVAIALAPIKLTYQLFALLIDPIYTRSIGEYNYYDTSAKMRAHVIEEKIGTFQAELCELQNCLGGPVSLLSAIPVAAIDVGAEVLKSPLAALENLFFYSAISLAYYSLMHAR